MKEKTLSLELRECNSDIFKITLPFLDQYGIYYFGNEFALVNRKNSTIFHIFDDLKQIAPSVYALFKNNKDGLVIIKYIDNAFISITGLKQILKVFKEYVLVEYPNGNKALHNLNSFEKVSFETLTGYSEEKQYVIIKLPNDKFTLLTKDLRVSDIEFTAIKEDLKSFVIVKFDNMFSAYAVIRLKDLKESPKYFNIHFYGNSDEYVKVYEFSNPSRIMKISNFETSEGYLSIEYLSNKYALVKEDCYSEEKILRLNDFSVSKWEKK